MCFCAAAKQRRLPIGWLKRRLAITPIAEQEPVAMVAIQTMAARRVVAAVAEAVSELQSGEADSDQHLNEMLIH